MAQTIVTPSALGSNLRSLAKRNADLAQKLGEVQPRPDVTFVQSGQGVAAVSLADMPLCSRHRPLDEAKRLTDGIDLVEHAVVVVLGFAAGYHVQHLAQRYGKVGTGSRGRWHASPIPMGTGRRANGPPN
ncbi:MAG: hypothetical protein O6758_08280 [Planctomycetota bacterium]|nr:hypothetical protein [Planctomycetota bacterium]